MEGVKGKGKTGGKTRTQLKKKTLKIKGFKKCPHRAFVKEMIRKKLHPLRDVLKIDFTGKAKQAKYIFTFEHDFKPVGTEKIGFRYWPFWMGVSGTCNATWLSKMNYCEDSNDPKSCTPVYPSNPDMLLGKVIANTALHEIAHLLGLLDEKSYTGADKAGHTGDTSNCMFDITLHKDYRELGQKDERTEKYILKTGETLATVARKKGLRSKVYLAKLRGKDGRSNEEILKSVGKEIWIQDIKKVLKFRREAESKDKTFNSEQISFMREWVKKGKTMLELKMQ